jgi:hypothetical protein
MTVEELAAKVLEGGISHVACWRGSDPRERFGAAT